MDCQTIDRTLHNELMLIYLNKRIRLFVNLQKFEGAVRILLCEVK